MLQVEGGTITVPTLDLAVLQEGVEGSLFDQDFTTLPLGACTFPRKPISEQVSRAEISPPLAKSREFRFPVAIGRRAGNSRSQVLR